MENNKYSIISRSTLRVLLLLITGFISACTDSNDVVIGNIAISDNEMPKTVDWDEVESSVSFNANSSWTATVDDVTSRAAHTQISWIKLTCPSGSTGDNKMPMLLTKNDNDTYREATITVKCGDKLSQITIHQNANPDAVHIMDVSKIPDYDKYYCPGTWNEGFEKGPEGMLRSDAKWSWWRHKSSEHFFVFWAPGFGDNPNAESVPEALRVDIDDLLAKAENFYKTNVEKLGMATTGQGKSSLDKYKMEIYLLYQTDWLATGSGYDNTIGALWVNPSTCKPVGSTIGHEIGHSFQFQVSADKLFTGETQALSNGIIPVGFRYGFGQDGAGGCAFWEQCAQWQSFQDYPQEAFTQDANVQVWLKNHNRRFNHEWQRYASYWFQYYYTQKHGIQAYSRIWKESKYPEDPIETYTRLYCGSNLNTLYSDMYDYAAHCANYDFDAVHQYVTDAALNYGTKLYKNSKGYYQVSYDNCPGTTGFNLIPLNIPDAGTDVTAHFNALAVGSALAAGDAGEIVDGDGKSKGNVSTYNKQSNTSAGYRYGFVAIDSNDKSHYGEMFSATSGDATFSIPSGTKKLYLVVLGAPSTYNREGWDDDETNDEQWPYEVSFSNTDLLGNVTIPTGSPEDITLSHSVNLDASSADYVLGTMNLLNNGDMGKIAKAFKIQPAEIAAGTLAAGSVTANGPTEGKIAIANTNPDGSISYAYSANGTGFWIMADGTAGKWGDSPVYFEYNFTGYSLAYGHKPGATTKDKSYTIRPTMVYMKDGKLYKAVIDLQMNF